MRQFLSRTVCTAHDIPAAGSMTATIWSVAPMVISLNFADKFRIFATEGGQICLVFRKKSRISGRKNNRIDFRQSDRYNDRLLLSAEHQKICACPLPSVLRERGEI